MVNLVAHALDIATAVFLGFRSLRMSLAVKK